MVRQLLAVQLERRTDPKWVGKVIAAWVCRVGVNQDAQIAAVEHQPGYERCENLCRKGNLIHGLVMRTDLDVVPSPERHGKAFADPVAQPLAFSARGRGVVVNVGMEACDFAGRPRSGCL